MIFYGAYTRFTAPSIIALSHAYYPYYTGHNVTSCKASLLYMIVSDSVSDDAGCMMMINIMLLYVSYNCMIV